MKLLVIGHVWPQPNATAAGEHMLHLLEFFKKMNYEILFVSSAQIPEKYTALESLEIKTIEIKINDDSFDQLIKDLNPTVVLFDRFMTEEQFSWRVYNSCPNAIRILDTEDLHFLRNQRQETLKGNTIDYLSDIAKREIASIYRSDLSLIISQKEIELLTQEYGVPNNLLTYVPLLSQTELTIKIPSYDQRKDLIFVGNFLHQPNWNCVQYLKKEIWPKLSKLLPRVTLNIYGSHASQKHLQLSNPKERFIIHGFIEDINTELLKSRLLVAPIQFGAGQKGKLLKAMQCGLPNITTTIGVEGMLFNNKWAGDIVSTPNDFIEKTVNLYNNQLEWQNAQKLCKQIIKQSFNFEKHYQLFQNRLKILQKELLQHRAKNITGQVLWHHNLRSTEFMSRWIQEKNKRKTPN